ncbi:MAG: AAA family ATPase [Verrucomicrobiota bacterium]
MQITAINFDRSDDLGLAPIKMDHLGKVVLIAGRNGSGKTRLLARIESSLMKGPLGVLQRNYELYHNALVNEPRYGTQVDWMSQYESHTKKFRERESVTIDVDAELAPRVVQFVPTMLALVDPQQLTPMVLLNSSKEAKMPGVSTLSKSALPMIQACQDSYYEATHPKKTISIAEAAQAVGDYERLNLIIERFLGVRLERSINREAMLFGHRIGLGLLSAGQKVLLQLCVAIYAQGATLNDFILMMDEPENHLHPAALLDVIEDIREKIGDGQLWIATHSVPLLANLENSALWWMEDGHISKAGKTPELVLRGLLGKEERISKIADFIDLPFVIASNRYAYECLLPPDVIAGGKADPQMLQIRDALKKSKAPSAPLRILDFGAGKGRLALELADSYQSSGLEVDYVAFDSSKIDAGECSTAVSRLCAAANLPQRVRLFHDMSVLRAEFDEGSFDVVVMCNVLHEILPESWIDYFGPSGKITKLLKPTGSLLLVEVQQLPYGERAHHLGFLVLDTPHLKKLFSITEADAKSFLVNAERDGWLKAHLIHRSLIARFAPATLREALVDLKATAKDRIRDLRGKTPSYFDGRLHGFWVQQLANATLGLNE